MKLNKLPISISFSLGHLIDFVQDIVVRFGYYNQIIHGVVKSIPVNMMNHFFREKFSTYFFLCIISMFINAAGRSWDIYHSVSIVNIFSARCSFFFWRFVFPSGYSATFSSAVDYFMSSCSKFISTIYAWEFNKFKPMMSNNFLKPFAFYFFPFPSEYSHLPSYPIIARLS